MAGAFFGVTVIVDTGPLERLMGTSKPVAENLVRKHAYEFERVAKQNAPVDTSALRNSIHTNGGGMNYTVSDGVEYGVYQEFGINHPFVINSPVYMRGIGWRYMKIHPGFPPQPFFTPAAEYVGSKFFTLFFPTWLGGG